MADTGWNSSGQGKYGSGKTAVKKEKGMLGIYTGGQSLYSADGQSLEEKALFVHFGIGCIYRNQVGSFRTILLLDGVTMTGKIKEEPVLFFEAIILDKFSVNSFQFSTVRIQDSANRKAMILQGLFQSLDIPPYPWQFRPALVIGGGTYQQGVAFLVEYLLDSLGILDLGSDRTLAGQGREAECQEKNKYT